MKFRHRLLVTFSAMAVFTTVGLVAPGPSPAGAGSAKSTITIGYISDLTGFAASTFADGPPGAQARVDLQNAKGGVNGHKLKLVVADDQSSGVQNSTASQYLASKGVFGIIDFSAFAYGGYKFLQAQGIPVVGAGFDGPEWNQPPNTNMFDYGVPSSGLIQGSYYTSTQLANSLKLLGVTKLAALGYGISPSSTQSIKSLLYAASKIGIANCYENTTVPFGAVDFTADVLQIKQKGCDGVVGSFVESSDVALSQAVKNGGVNAKQLYFTGYSQDVLTTPLSRAAFNGAYVGGATNFTEPNAATKVMLDALKKYDPNYKGGIPDLGLYGSYVAADLMIFGLEHAGQNPTRAAFIKNLRKVSNYNAGGILPSPTSFQHFGTPQMLPKTTCAIEFQLQGTKFVPINKGKPICGKYIPVPANYG